MNESLQVSAPWIVRFGGSPVCIIRRHAGLVYSLCHIDDATRFDTLSDAQEAGAILPIVPGKIINIETVPGEPVPV